jgi:hypothetical protein
MNLIPFNNPLRNTTGADRGLYGVAMTLRSPLCRTGCHNRAKRIFLWGWHYLRLEHCPDGSEFLYKILNAKGYTMFLTLTRFVKTALAPAVAAVMILLSPAIGNFDGLGPHGTSLTALPSLGVDLLPLNNGADPHVVSPGVIGGFSHSGSFVLTNNADNFLPANGPSILFRSTAWKSLPPLDCGMSVTTTSSA